MFVSKIEAGMAPWELELLYPILGTHHTSLEDLNGAMIDDYYADLYKDPFFSGPGGEARGDGEG